ncbi:hypothetical protein MTR67_052022 [Solanum verrucosum]|uniref:Uncharacterized protein n=1 Tax=Solanum verrucosum TaxID=315347 RepID=A0AAF0ZZL1_SOLVR|nr:hypothetical protein MTR67_052022 [Solanum verrucosum]
MNICDGIIEKTEKKLAVWKSRGGVVLINAVLDSSPTYVMSLFPTPDKVVKILDNLSRNFLRQGNKIEKSFNLVKWITVQQSKKFGGLGVRNLKLQNKSLLKKRLWRFAQEEHSLWKEVILRKYGQKGQRYTNEVSDTYGVGA